jgi:hypothetical protein
MMPSAFRVLCVLIGALIAAGCVTRPPSIAHVHIGHAITGVHITPGHKGYVLVAEQRADEGLVAAQRAGGASELSTLKPQIAAAVAACSNDDDFGLRESLTLAANHIAFAATSPDASANVIAFAPLFKSNIAAVIARCQYIELLGNDVARTSSMAEAQTLVREIAKAAMANVEGDDSEGRGVKGSVPADYGVMQLRQQVLDMIAREHPAYRTVDEWYLFNLVRLPNGRWVFDKFGRGGNIDGYK